MNDDPNTNARIQALKSSAGAVPVAAPKTNPPPDAARLLPALIDLAAEQRLALRTLQQKVTDLTTLATRLPQELPASCRQATRDELLPLRSQLTGQTTRLESAEGHAIRAAATSEDCAGTIRAGIIITSLGILAVIAVIIVGRYL